MVSVTRRTRGTTDVDVTNAMEERLLAALESRLDDGEGFTALSVERLATAAGISRATFYLHFRDKSDLIARLLARVEDEVVNAGGLWFENAERARYADLRAVMKSFLTVYRKHHAILRAAAETAAYDPEVERLYQRMIGRFRTESTRAVTRIARAGRAHPHLPPMLADVLSWSTDYCYVNFGTTMDDKALERLLDAMTHVVWYSIFAEAPGTEEPVERAPG